MNTTEEINVGIDTSKTMLDIYVRPLDQFFSVDLPGFFGSPSSINRDGSQHLRSHLHQ